MKTNAVFNIFAPFKGIGSILFLKKWLEIKIAEKTIKIISEEITMKCMYVQL